MTFGELNDQDRLPFHDRGARQRRRRCVEPQILSNASVHQSSRRKSAKQPQTIRKPAGRVAEFWAVGDGRFQHNFGHDDVRLIQHLLGHRSVRTTEIYLKSLVPETVRPNEVPIVAEVR
jgi:hypothetical protein